MQVPAHFQEKLPIVPPPPPPGSATALTMKSPLTAALRLYIPFVTLARTDWLVEDSHQHHCTGGRQGTSCKQHNCILYLSVNVLHIPLFYFVLELFFWEPVGILSILHRNPLHHYKHLKKGCTKTDSVN